MDKIKIVIVGGGSNAWTPHIVKDMMLTEGLKDAEFVLYDINKKSADLCKAFLEKLALQLSIRLSITSTDNRATALKNADYIVITVSTGGFDAMQHDIEIPEDYGIYHTVGDTSGPGGWSRTIRNFGAFAELADAINKYAPRAMVLNYSNPMPTLTDILSRLCHGPVVGLCHGLFENMYFIKEFYKLADEKEIAVKYAGVNHFFWITQAMAGNIDVIADLKKRLGRKSFSDLLPQDHKDPMGFSSGRAVADELFRMTGVMPYLGDRHTCEYFSWFITSRENIKRYGIKRTTIKERRDNCEDRRQKLIKMIKGKIDKLYLTRSCETAADIIDAHSQGKVFIDIGNMPNSGQVANLPHGAIVETAVRVDRNGISPVNFGMLPDSIVGLIEPWTRVFTMTIDACFAGDRQMALQALRLDPVCADLNYRQVSELGGRLLNAHRRFIKCF